jgi:8-oxo-dGTP diphosphatase
MKRGVDAIGVAVAAVITDDEANYLLLQRTKAPDAGHWSIPGGTVEFSETVERALKRELEEELGIEVDIVQLLRVTNYIHQENTVHWVIPTFLVKITAGTPVNKEPATHAQMKWFAKDDLPENITKTAALGIQSCLSLDSPPVNVN